jgi:hypothetical protein
MTREELEHIIRASADITDQYEFVIIGSQSMRVRKGWAHLARLLPADFPHAAAGA